MSLRAHYWSIAPSLRHRFRPDRGPASRGWSTVVPDERWGTVRLSGLLAVHPEPRGLVLVVHGMGGRPSSHYMVRAAEAAWSMGFSSLRLALRGADRQGEDFYHAGLTADLRAALTCPEIAPQAPFFVLGYSLGGHVSLKLAAERSVPGIRAVAAVCPPLDLVTTAHALDHEVPAIYRHYVLGGLKSIYRQVARRRSVPSSVWSVLRARTVREWDERAVCPRHGFPSPDAYYETQSVAPRLGEIEVPTLIVSSERDPLVPVRTTRATLRHRHAGIEYREASGGGHVGFPPEIDLGLDGPRGAETQIMSWFRKQQAR